MFAADDLVRAEQASGDIKLLETLADADPDHDGYSALAAQLIGGYSFGFVDPVLGPSDTPDPAKVDEAKALYTKGRAYGLRALTRHKAFAAAMDQDIDAFRAALAEMTVSDVPALFWTAYNWGQLINLSKDDPDLVAQLPRVVALMDRVQELAPSYYHGGAYMFAMVNAAARPQLLGGQPEVAKAAYEKARAIDGGKFLTTDVMFAQYYAVQVQDPALFKQLLGHVLAAPDDILPAETLANALAKRRARILLSKISDFFPDLDDASGSDDATPSAPAEPYTEPATGTMMKE